MIKLFFSIVTVIFVQPINAQVLYVDPLFSNNGFEKTQMDNQLRRIELYRSSEGYFKTFGLEVFSAPPFVYFEDYFVTSYNECGKIDSSYSNNGIFKLSDYLIPFDINLVNENYINSSSWNNNKGVILTGCVEMEYANSQFNYSPLMIKIDSNGNADPNFLIQDLSYLFDSISIETKVTYNYGEEISNNGLLFWGQFKNSESEGFIISKYKANGTLDSTFNGTGFKLIDIPFLNFQQNQVLKQSNGSYLIAANNQLNNSLILLNMDQDGNFIQSFGNNGRFEDFNNIAYGKRFMREQNMKSIITQELPNLELNQNVVVNLYRYLQNGQIDSTFGTNGKSTLEISEATEGIITGFDVFENNKIIIGFNQYWNPSFGCTTILKEDGSIDSMFANFGRIIHNFDSTYSVYCSLIEEDENNFILAGLSGHEELILTKFTSENKTPNLTHENNYIHSNVSSSNVNYQWYFNNIEIENGDSSSINISLPGEYSILIHDSYYCNSLSDSILITSVNTKSIDSNKIRINPNPAKSIISLAGIEKETEYRIIDMYGNCLINGIVNQADNQVQISKLKNGIYTIVFNNSSYAKIVKFE